MVLTTGLLLTLWTAHIHPPLPNRVIPWKRIEVTDELGSETVQEDAAPGEPRLQGSVRHTVVGEDGAAGQKSCTARFGYGHLAITRRPGIVPSVSIYAMPVLAKDELCPLFGGVYQAEEDCDKGRFPLKFVPHDELPTGVKVPDRYAIVLPHTRGFSEGSFFCGVPDEPPGLTQEERRRQMVECRLYLMKVDKVVKFGKDYHTATLKYWTPREEEQEAKVSEGDILVVGKPVNAGLVVKAIVPPDKTTKVIGWVELSGFHVPLDEVEKVAKDEKRKVVKFEKDDVKK